MCLRHVYDLPSVFSQVQNILRSDSKRYTNAQYYFRGERTNFEDDRANTPPNRPPVPGIYRHRGLVEHESDILNEAIRMFPSQFKDDKTTFEVLTRMQHYGYATRLLDVTPKITTAIAMVLSPDTHGNRHVDKTGFIHIYRVSQDKIKYSTGDTVTALSNLARINYKHVDLEDLNYLAYECKNERAGFIWMSKSNRRMDKQGVSQKLDRDIQKVWCVKPVVNNPRIDFQLGEFFLFGCGHQKQMLDVSLSEMDYTNEVAATEGIARIAVLAVHPDAKSELVKMETYLDIGVERIYPDFHYHSQTINDKYKEDS